MKRLTRKDAERIVREARQEGETPNLLGTSLCTVDLSSMDLAGVNLDGADFTGSSLRAANLAGASLRGGKFLHADLRDANLSGAKLTCAKFFSSDLRGADFTDANLPCADLNSTDLAGAIFTGADLSSVTVNSVRGMPVLFIVGMPFGRVILLPTPDGWHLRIGNWAGTPDELREVLAGDGWRSPDERERRPRLLAAVADLADAFIADNPDPHFATIIERKAHIGWFSEAANDLTGGAL